MKLSLSLIRTIACAALLVGVDVTAGCATAPDAAADESAITDAALTLGDVLPEAAELGITDAVVRKVFDPRFDALGHGFEENRYYLKIEFPDLTKAQFNGLRKIFGDHSQVRFEAGKAYELADFLHPAMQAVANQTYAQTVYSGGASLQDLVFDLFPTSDDSEETSKKRNLAVSLMNNEFSNLTNCYNTSAEIVRMMHPERKGNMEMFLYFPDRFQADFWFGAAEPYSAAEIPSRNDFSERVDETDLSFGDVLVVRNRNDAFMGHPLLAHTAIVLSQKLLFEKTDSSSDDPYRVSLRSDVLAMYERKLNDRLSVDYRRFNGDEAKPIPAPKVPSGEIPDDGASGPLHRLRERIQSDYPDLKLDNVTLSTDEGFGMGGSATLPSEIERATVVIGPDGRGVLEARKAVLSRFEPLEDARR